MTMERVSAKVATVQCIGEVRGMSNEEVRRVMLESAEALAVECVNWPAYPYAPKVECRVAYAADSLVVMFDVEESHIRALSLENNGPVWEDSCVEFFVANPCGEGYFNFEINCVGTLLAAYRRSRTDADMFGEEKLSKVRHFGSLPHEKIDSTGESQRWWMVEIIPFELLGLEDVPEELKVNFYKCGDGCQQMHFLSWSPIGLPEPNFHCPEFFGTLKLTK